MGNSIKLKDVAAIADVSEATVSYVMNGKAEKMKITPATQARVLAAVRQTGYTPNRQARDMALGRSPQGGEERVVGCQVDKLLGESPASPGELLGCRVDKLLGESPASPSQLSSCSVAELLSECANAHSSLPLTTQQPNNTTTFLSGATQQLNNLTTALSATGYRLIPVTNMDDLKRMAAEGLVGVVYSAEQSAVGSWQSAETEGNVGGALRAATGSPTSLGGTIAATALRQSSGQDCASHIEEAQTSASTEAAGTAATTTEEVVGKPTETLDLEESRGPVFEARDPASEIPKTEGNVGGALRAAISQKEDKESTAAPVIVAPQEPVAAEALRQSSGQDCASHIEEAQTSASTLEAEPEPDPTPEPEPAPVLEPVSEHVPVVAEPPAPNSEPEPPLPVVERVPDTIILETGSSRQSGILPPEEAVVFSPAVTLTSPPTPEVPAPVPEPVSEHVPVIAEPPAPNIKPEPPLPVVEMVPDTIIPETGSSRQSGILPPSDASLLEGESRVGGMSRVDEEIPEVPTPSSSSGQAGSNVYGQGSMVSSPSPAPSTTDQPDPSTQLRAGNPTTTPQTPGPTPAPIVVPRAPLPIVLVETPPPAIETPATPAPVIPPEPEAAVAPPPESATTLTQDGSSRQSGILPPEESVVSGLMSEVLAPPAEAEPAGDNGENPNT